VCGGRPFRVNRLRGEALLTPAFVTIFGKAGGAFRTGRRVNLEANRNINDILTTVVKTMGLNVNQVGDPEFNMSPLSLS
jgi:hypothetical protein